MVRHSCFFTINKYLNNLQHLPVEYLKIKAVARIHIDQTFVLLQHSSIFFFFIIINKHRANRAFTCRKSIEHRLEVSFSLSIIGTVSNSVFELWNVSWTSATPFLSNSSRAVRCSNTRERFATHTRDTSWIHCDAFHVELSVLRRFTIWRIRRVEIRTSRPPLWISPRWQFLCARTRLHASPNRQRSVWI